MGEAPSLRQRTPVCRRGRLCGHASGRGGVRACVGRPARAGAGGTQPLTLAGGHRAAPLAAAPALSARRTPQHVAAAAGEVHHVVEVELGAAGEPVGGVPGVAARDGCWGGKATSPPGRACPRSRHRLDQRAPAPRGRPRSPAGAAAATSQGLQLSGRLVRGQRGWGGTVG